MKSITRFVAYNNAVPLAIALMILGGSGAFAATDPDAILKTEYTVVSVDNTYIAAKDLSVWTPTATIASVTEDNDSYYVAYDLSTIDVVDAVWKDTVKHNSITVSKAQLGSHRDLGNFVTAQLKDIIDHEIQRLSETQSIERKQVTQKTVATTYSGLVGKMLNDSTETLPGYTPVVDETPVQPAAPQVASANEASAPAQTQEAAPQAASYIQVLGANPSSIPLKTDYVDLGAVITDAAHQNLGIHYFVNGTEQQYVQIDTTKVGTTTVRYQITDAAGNIGSAERTVIVYDPAPTPAVAPIETPAVTETPAPAAEVTPAATTTETSEDATATSTQQ